MQILLLSILVLLVAATHALDLESMLNTDNFITLDAGDPTPEPSAAPTMIPTADPTTEPTQAPTAPTARPTAVPTARPTTAAPSALPTPPGLNLITFSVVQEIFDLDEDYYNANKEAIDLTYMQAIAATMNGVSPEDVKDLLITFKSVRRMRRLQVNTATATFRIVTHVPGATYESLSSQFIAASSPGGNMNDLIASFATENGVPDFIVTEPQVENALKDRGASEKLTGAQIAGLVIGIFMFLGLMAIFVAFAIQAAHPPQRTHETVVTQL